MTEPRKTSLTAGDEVELRHPVFPGVVIAGPVALDGVGCCLLVGPMILVQNGESVLPEGSHLTITKMAPRPFYANHEREEPVENDVARDAESATRSTYTYSGGRWWVIQNGSFSVAAALPIAWIGDVHETRRCGIGADPLRQLPGGVPGRSRG